MQTRSPFAGKSMRWKRAILFSLSVLLCISPLSAQQKSLPLEKRAAIEKAVASFMSANSIPGLSAAVVLEGEPRWSQGFGMADLENSSPATSSTLFRLRSEERRVGKECRPRRGMHQVKK